MLLVASIENLKYLNIIPLRKKIISDKYKNEDERISKEEESIETLQIFGLIENM